MNKVIKTLVLVCFVFLVIGLGYFSGKYICENLEFRYDNNKVAIRVELPLKDVDYDLQASLNILKCKFEKEGKKVYFSYAGDMYPKELNDAKINVFVRGYAPGLDKRIADNTHNIYFVHRFEQGYVEEFRNFDEYMSTNKDLVSASNRFGINMSYLEPEICKKDVDFSEEGNGILYIYEDYNMDVIYSIKRIGNVKVYDVISYNNLSEKEKLEELRNAKVVVFDAKFDIASASGGVAYAVYDILSYGKNVITDWNRDVERLQAEGKKVKGFKDYNELFMMLLYGQIKK